MPWAPREPPPVSVLTALARRRVEPAVDCLDARAHACLDDAGPPRFVALRLARAQHPSPIQTLRHRFADHLREDGCGIYTIRGILGHRGIETVTTCTSVATRNRSGVRSPLDR